MKNDKNDYLSKKTKRGILFLVLLCLLIAYTPRVYRYFNPFPKVQLSVHEKAALESKMQQEKKGNEGPVRYKQQEKRSEKWQCTPPASRFDPNDLEQADWQNLGLSEKQAQVVMKFSRNGLNSINDLKKIYVLSPEFIACIQDSVKFTSTNGQVPIVKKETKVSKVNVNTASKEELMTVKGIGDFYAKQIIQLRTELGGIHSVLQLKDLPYMDDTKMQQLETYLVLNEHDLKTININEAGIDELKTHPYVSYKVANSIVKMRKQLGGYQQLDEIQKSVLIDAELFQKIKPYLSL